MEFFTNNWEYVLLAFYVVEKVVRISPSKKDDVLLDMVLKPLFNALKGNR